MKYLGSLLFSIIMISSVIIFTLLNLCLFFLPYRTRSKLLKIWAKMVIFSLGKLCHLKVEFEGLENIPSEPCIIFSKHQSTLETIALQLHFNPLVWVLKRELLYIPFFGWT